MLIFHYQDHQFEFFQFQSFFLIYQKFHLFQNID